MVFGCAMNERYCTIMEEILEQIDDTNKQLCHPIKDFDDVHVAMAVFKEIREHKIQMDMSINPTEVILILLIMYMMISCFITFIEVLCHAQQIPD